jgi:hypothetical protein
MGAARGDCTYWGSGGQTDRYAQHLHCLVITIVIIIIITIFRILPYIPDAILLEPSLAFKTPTDPIDTSAQAALAPHQTMEQKESADTAFMAL